MASTTSNSCFDSIKTLFGIWPGALTASYRKPLPKPLGAVEISRQEYQQRLALVVTRDCAFAPDDGSVKLEP